MRVITAAKFSVPGRHARPLLVPTSDAAKVLGISCTTLVQWQEGLVTPELVTAAGTPAGTTTTSVGSSRRYAGHQVTTARGKLAHERCDAWRIQMWTVKWNSMWP